MSELKLDNQGVRAFLEDAFLNGAFLAEELISQPRRLIQDNVVLFALRSAAVHPNKDPSMNRS